MTSTAIDADARHGAEARLALAERPGDFPPLAQRVERDADQAGDRRPVGVLIPLRDETNGWRRRRTPAACRSSRRLRKSYSASDDHPRQRSLSTDFAVRNSPKLMKLK